MSAVEVFWKCCGKRRNCSLQAISPFSTAFSTLQEIFPPMSSNLKLSSAISLSLEVCNFFKFGSVQNLSFGKGSRKGKFRLSHAVKETLKERSNCYRLATSSQLLFLVSFLEVLSTPYDNKLCLWNTNTPDNGHFVKSVTLVFDLDHGNWPWLWYHQMCMD